MEVIRQLLPALVQLLNNPDVETQGMTLTAINKLKVLLVLIRFCFVADSCWALSYLTDGTNEKIQEVVNSGAIPFLVQKMATSDASVVTPALRTLGNIVTG